MFWKNIKNYSSFEKKCNCCKQTFCVNDLLKKDEYYGGCKNICYKCWDIMEKIIKEFTEIHGKISGSDKIYLSQILPTI